MATELGGADRAAVLLLSLGAEAATQIMRHLDETEVRKVSQALARMRRVESTEIDEISREFQSSLVAGDLAIDGRAFALSVVKDALGDEAAVASAGREEILADLEQGADTDQTLAQLLRGVPAPSLARIIEGEHPQVAALILAHASPGETAATIAGMDEAAQSDIVNRLAKLEPVSPRFARDLSGVLKGRLKGISAPSQSSFGGLKAVAEVMNHLDKDAEARIFGELEALDLDMVNEIRGLMFTIEDCKDLDGRSLQTVLKEIARDDLMLSLKTASTELKEKVFSNMSARAAEILQEDMQASGPVRLRDVEEAQARVVAAIRELDAEGKIVLGGSGGDVFV